MIWLDLLLLSCTVVFFAYLIWYFFLAKTNQPLSREDVTFTWKVHKQQTGCTASQFQNLLNNRSKEVVGFKCDCGYEFRQNRLLTQEIIR
jgi:hypothetical protein